MLLITLFICLFLISLLCMIILILLFILNKLNINTIINININKYLKLSVITTIILFILLPILIALFDNDEESKHNQENKSINVTSIKQQNLITELPPQKQADTQSNSTKENRKLKNTNKKSITKSHLKEKNNHIYGQFIKTNKMKKISKYSFEVKHNFNKRTLYTKDKNDNILMVGDYFDKSLKIDSKLNKDKLIKYALSKYTNKNLEKIKVINDNEFVYQHSITNKKYKVKITTSLLGDYITSVVISQY